MITAECLRELLHYDPETGVFTRRVATGRLAKVGDVAGCVNNHGYRQISLGSRLYGEHRLAWLYMTGEWPAQYVDHINCVRDDNRWANLREATMSQNMANIRKPKHNTSGFKGVGWCASRGRWEAHIQINGKSTNLGRFDAIEDAEAARRAAEEKHFGEFARVS